MGIHDRDYARNDGRSVFDGFAARTQVCIALIVANVFFFLVQLATRGPFGGAGWFTEALLLDGEKVLNGEVWRLFTHAFLHDYGENGVFHIGFNMLWLWWAGSNVEDLYGAKEFLCFYLTAVLVAALAYLGVEYLVEQRSGRALGASGAVSAVMVVYALHYPMRIVHLFGLVPVPVWSIVIFQVLNDSLGLLGVSREPIAFAAHLGGALFGLLYFLLTWRVSNWIPGLGSWSRKTPTRPPVKPVKIFTEIVPDEEEEQTSRPVSPLPVAPAGVSARTASPAGGDRSKVDEHLEAKLDEVLEKVTKFGQASLTDSEREILQKASEIYRKKKGR